jgi:hypothetical protein
MNNRAVTALTVMTTTASTIRAVRQRLRRRDRGGPAGLSAPLGVTSGERLAGRPSDFTAAPGSMAVTPAQSRRAGMGVPANLSPDGAW